MNNKELSELANRYQSMSTEDLFKAVTIDRKDYQLEAIKLIEKELTIRNVPLDLAQEAQQKIEQDEMIKDSQLNGVRGWLMIFVIILAANSIFLLVSGVDTLTKTKNMPGFILFFSLLMPLLGCYGLFASILLIKRNKAAPAHTRRWLITFLVYSLLYTAAIFKYSTAKYPLFVSAASSLVFSAVWLSYLKASRRVALTYQKNHKS
jgi:hypothetical protein